MGHHVLKLNTLATKLCDFCFLLVDNSSTHFRPLIWGQVAMTAA